MRIAAILLAITAGSCLSFGVPRAEVPEAITVEKAIALTLKNHPAIQQAEYNATASKARIDISHSDRYPDVSFDGTYTRVGPVSQFDLSGAGAIDLAPHNNYNFHVGLEQTLYDFGKTDAAIRAAEASHRTASDMIEIVRFNLAYQTISVFNSLLILHQRIDVLDEQLQTLSQHLEISVRRIKAGTATDFDTLTIQVRIAVVRNDRIDAQHALETQEIAFRQLTGLPADAPIVPRGGFVADRVALNSDSLLASALEHRPELVLSRDAEKSAVSQSRVAALSDKPKLALNFTTGLKNGYEPNLNTWRGNFAAGLELKVPIFNGYKRRYEVVEADANLSSSRAHTSDIERQVGAEVQQAVAAVRSSLEKITGTETQVRQAEEAVAMARVRYNAGVVTNLDLLDAETTLSQTKLIRVRALYDYTVSLNALSRATGARLW